MSDGSDKAARESTEALAAMLGRLRRTNDPLSRLEDTNLRCCLEESEELLRVVDTDIITLKGQLEERIREREAVQATITECRGLLSPLRRLPVELLSQIFTECLPDMTFTIPDPLNAPLLPAQVCSSWRKIAVSTPGLWSSLQLEMAYKDDLRVQYIKADLLQSWLSRAGGRPLNLLYADNREETEGPEGPDMFHILAKFLPRCRVLHVFALSAETLGSVRFPILETLDISIVFRLPREFLAWAPRIKTLKVSWPHLTHLNLNNMAWDRLTDLSIRAIHRPRECINALRRCSGLKSCSLEFIRHWEQEPVDRYAETEKVFLPRLQSLTLTTHTSANFDAVPELILAPNLKHLAIQSLFSKAGTYELWASMIADAGITLETFDLHSTQTPFESLEEFLSLLELTWSLRKLSITGPEANDPFDARTNEFMETMTHRGPDAYRTTSRLLPRLEELIISVDSEPFSCHLVNQMLLSRMKEWPEDSKNVATTVLKRADIRLSGFEADKGRRWTISDDGEIMEDLVDRLPWEMY